MTAQQASTLSAREADLVGELAVLELARALLDEVRRQTARIPRRPSPDQTKTAQRHDQEDHR